MKTQLLEDIGQSATLSLTPSKIVGNSEADNEVQNLAPAGYVEPARPRSTLGVWSQKPAGEPLIPPTQQPDEQPTPLDLHSVFEEIAALEAQYVPPERLHEPATAPAEPLHKPAIPPAEATLAPNPTQSATAPQDSLFDFTPPSPAPQAADPFTPAPTGPTRSRRRYLLWGACVLSGALLIQGGRWLYQERNDVGSRALIAGEAKQEPQVDNAMKRRAIAAKEFTLEPDGDVRVTPAVPASRPLPAAPPLVLPEPEPVAEQGPVSPSPKPSGQIAREQSKAAAEPATEGREREPVRQYARASGVATERPSERETPMAARLRVCREHGYHAAQCIKRACRMTKHGFVCRGR